jgi:biopolymer transport protein ExbB
MQAALERLADLFLTGGPVMWPLLALSVVSVAITIERSVFWLRTHRPGWSRRLDRLAGVLRTGDRAAAKQAATSDASLYGAVVRDLADHPQGDGVAIELVERFRPRFERSHAVLATIVTAAPLLGILGTVLGIITAFDLMSAEGGVADVASVAAGIAEALITTAFGLIVALVTLFPYMAFRAQADRAIGAIERLVASSQWTRSAEPRTPATETTTASREPSTANAAT